MVKHENMLFGYTYPQIAKLIEADKEHLFQDAQEENRAADAAFVKGAVCEANARQVGGAHYKSDIQHWDYVAANNLGYLEAQIIKYVTRWHKKNGVQDLEKARHFLDKLIEQAQAGVFGGTNATGLAGVAAAPKQE